MQCVIVVVKSLYFFVVDLGGQNKVPENLYL